MSEEEAEQWATSLLVKAVQFMLGQMNTRDYVEEEAMQEMWSDGTIDMLIDLIDTATCSIEVSWMV